MGVSARTVGPGVAGAREGRPMPTPSPHRRRLPSGTAVTFALGAAVALLPVSHARADGDTSLPAVLTGRTLSRLEPCQWDELFARGTVGALPVGLGRGRVLFVSDAKLPRARASLAGVAWKGKYFDPDGGFINQWVGFRAVASRVAVGPSWLDGRPCIVLEYPPGTAVFGNARDELREVAPGVFLGRFYERCPCPKLRGYFVLEMDDPCGHTGL